MSATKMKNASCLLICFLSIQGQVKAQWIEPGNLDSYKSEAERLRALDHALTILEQSNPINDLRLAIKNKDFRFVGYYGYSLVVPEVPSNLVVWRIKKRIGFKVLKGSNDVMHVDTADRQQKVIEDYMRPYNKALLRYLRSLSKNKRTKKK